jgi:hypothetical protein
MAIFSHYYKLNNAARQIVSKVIYTNILRKVDTVTKVFNIYTLRNHMYIVCVMCVQYVHAHAHTHTYI